MIEANTLLAGVGTDRGGWAPRVPALAGNGKRRGRASLAGVLGGVAALVGLSLAVPADAADAAAGDAERARDKVAMCVGCHGIKGYRASYPEVYTVPMIAGQSERYLAAALEGYRKGDRSHPTMRAIAGSLSDQDILDLAAYYAKGGLTALGSAK